MVGIGRHQVLLVTGHAFDREPYELTDCRPFVTLVAGECGMSADQREPVVVVLNSLQRDGGLPPFHRVALLAILAQLALVNVRMAFLALRPHV